MTAGEDCARRVSTVTPRMATPDNTIPTTGVRLIAERTEA